MVVDIFNTDKNTTLFMQTHRGSLRRTVQKGKRKSPLSVIIRV